MGSENWIWKDNKRVKLNLTMLDSTWFGYLLNNNNNNNNIYLLILIWGKTVSREIKVRQAASYLVITHAQLQVSGERNC